MGKENGQSHDQDQTPATNLPRKGTFTDDLHQLVDNWARDAMNMMPQVKKGSKKNAQAHDVRNFNLHWQSSSKLNCSEALFPPGISMRLSWPLVFRFHWDSFTPVSWHGTHVSHWAFSCKCCTNEWITPCYVAESRWSLQAVHTHLMCSRISLEVV